MRKRFLALPAAAATAAIAAGLMLGVALPTPATSPASVTCQEDEPCFDPGDCYDTGNYICAAADPAEEEQGWDVWDAEGGPSYLKVDPSRPYKVAYNGTALRSPKLGTGQAAVPGKDGKWHVFSVEYTD